MRRIQLALPSKVPSVALQLRTASRQLTRRTHKASTLFPQLRLSPRQTHICYKVDRPSSALLIHTTHAAAMPGASDEDYAAFLEKATKSSASASASTSTAKGVTATTVNAEVPAALKSVDATYTSETDAPFQPVSLEVDAAASLDAALVRKLSGRGEVESVEMKSFDARGGYRDVVDAVRRAAGADADSGGRVGVFRVGLGGARCEYWVLGLDAEKSRVVGLRALAVES